MAESEPRWYAFRNAVRRRDYDLAQQMLAADRDLLTLHSRLGETVLHFLAVENDGTAVAWLHARGADLDTKNAFGTPVLFEVAQLRYKELFAWFVHHGADLKATNQYGEGLIDHLCEFGHSAMIDYVRQFGA